MESPKTLDCILYSSEEENAVFIEKNRDLAKSANKTLYAIIWVSEM